MKKTILLIVFSCVFFSCGIDGIVYLVPPIRVWDPSGLADDSQLYFEFTTSDSKNSSNAARYFKGFDIFYRIYESKAECISAIRAAESYNVSYPSASAFYLLSSLSFKFLTHTGRDPSSRPFIHEAPSDRLVRFRFSSFAADHDDFFINSVRQGQSLRQNGKNFQHIKRDDFDVKAASSPLTDPSLYVAVFAAASGTDDSLSTIYSEITKLGYVIIQKPSEF